MALTFPKNSADLNAHIAALRYYKDKHPNWVSNSDFDQQNDRKLKELLTYFRLIESSPTDDKRRKITRDGLMLLDAIDSKDQKQINEILITLLKTHSYANNVPSLTSNNSNFEPFPALFAALLKLDYLTGKDIAVLFQLMDNESFELSEAIEIIDIFRIYNKTLGTVPNYFKDCKPVQFLRNIGFLVKREGTKDYELSQDLETNQIFLDYVSTQTDSSTEPKKDSNVNLMSTSENIRYNTDIDITYQHNRIMFGAPGTGKSYNLNTDSKELLADGGEFARVTFHPDYSYAQFVGSYKPTMTDEDEITYEYIPGPFMRMYVKALKNAQTDNPVPHLLIIEEINRTNVAAVFGDVFQLLDRDENNVSEYAIVASEDIKRYLSKELGGKPNDFNEIKIPNNMFIWATMNSADQGVFPMDTAFKRRWNFVNVGIDDGKDKIEDIKIILGSGDLQHVVRWNDLREQINNTLASDKFKLNEDKLLGPFFVAMKDLETDDDGFVVNNDRFLDIFKSKVIMYLFEDAVKQKRKDLFSGAEVPNRYSSVCKAFDEKGVDLFGEDIPTNVYRESLSDAQPDDENDSIGDSQ